MSTSINTSRKVISLNEIFLQSKQKIELDIDFNNKSLGKPINSLTKLFFKIKENDLNATKKILYNKINSENVTSNLSINIELNDKKYDDIDLSKNKVYLEYKLHSENSKINKISLFDYDSNDLINLEYSCIENMPNYLNALYLPADSESSFKNINRVRKLLLF